MNILMVGSGKGSFQMRAVQLGAALGARVTSTPSETDWRWADVAVLIKKNGLRWSTAARSQGVPIVWDALDCWQQPAENGLTLTQACALLASQIVAIRPALVIGATRAMAKAAGGQYLPHHGWAGLHPTPVRETVRVVAYQGGAVYLGRWKDRLERTCAARGWTFVINPDDLSTADILVALRDGIWDGWMPRQWKSGVKLTNAILAGRPIITQPSAAWDEMQPRGSVIETEVGLETALDDWQDAERRAEVVIHATGKAPIYALETIVAAYRTMLIAVCEQVPCSA